MCYQPLKFCHRNLARANLLTGELLSATLPPKAGCTFIIVPLALTQERDCECEQPHLSAPGTLVAGRPVERETLDGHYL